MAEAKDILIKTTSEQEQCKVRSGTDNSCLRLAVVKVSGVAFCEPCAREQEAYANQRRRVMSEPRNRVALSRSGGNQ